MGKGLTVKPSAVEVSGKSGRSEVNKIFSESKTSGANSPLGGVPFLRESLIYSTIIHNYGQCLAHNRK